MNNEGIARNDMDDVPVDPDGDDSDEFENECEECGDRVPEGDYLCDDCAEEDDGEDD